MHTHVSLPVTVIRSVCKHDTYTTHGSSFKQITLFISINIQMHIKTTPSHWTASISCIKVGGVSPGSEFCDVIKSSSSSLHPAFDWHLHTQRERVLWNTVTRPDWRWWRKQQAVGVSRAQRLPEKASCKCGGRVAWAPDMRLFNTSEERRDRETHPRDTDSMRGSRLTRSHVMKSRRWTTHTQLWHLMYYKRSHELRNQNALDVFWQDIVQ